jgi:hypothetical protein
MAQPQGFRTFQIILALGFLAGFFAVLLFFFWKISDLNTDLNRISLATKVRGKIVSILRDARACELNFSGLKVGVDPISIRKIVDLRREAVLRVDQAVESKNIFVNALRVLPNHTGETLGKLNSTFILEMVFSDEWSSRNSPLKILLSANGKYNNQSVFTVTSCRVTSNDFAD